MLQESIEEILSRRKKFAIDCKSFFQHDTVNFLFEDDYYGDILVGYAPSAHVSLTDLPRTLVSGPVTHADFWTDGALLIRDRRPPRKTDVLIEFQGGIEDLLTHGFQMEKAFLLILGGKHIIPLVLMLSQRTWTAFNMSYVDFVAKTFRKAENPRFWLNRPCTGCILADGGLVLAYISRMAPNILLEMRTHRLLEKANAYSRD